MSALYDTIGIDYANLRKPDPRIAAQVDAALGDARTLLNVGAGAGSYEPRGRELTALEPSREMIAQRPEGSAPVVQGTAEHLPFADDSFEAVMAILTIHHWTDKARGLAEMRRVARDRVVLLTYDPAFRGQWQTEYWPALIGLDEGIMPPMEFFEQHLGPVDITPVLVPHDCSDGFLYAYWRRPEAYLDARIRKGSSSFWVIEGLEDGVQRLEADLASGKWAQHNAGLLKAESADMGYRLVIAEGLPC
ncbi:class I SAM-dependent methyltransferase [Parerythrobacter jejuensis]|uniref:Methyltransferase domain-containing protein n=1 Tax=Parerythrobacter jejuensis TaxID=795812 RepID=A0A845AKD5_9SPHN|nr:class I SAM-dependent methyltransferase [Parerythrobacter jejuensis]MXP31212.1 methyltransferase domain-containing protein [Parerythrobacter jejuensis]MXP33972.1 methyltransferase domain-containing protein [Parerythrobacter jejuensis]